ncbi:MAG: type IX secretion system membrane protein PorP/SprF [Chitinophagales bacterium]|nr:type IX secretion system membrane protein PorP/SprF [Chitinophagales bacterium]
MKNFTITLMSFVLAFGLKAQDMLNMNNFNFEKDNYNTACITTDSSSLKISTIVSLSDAIQNSSKFNFLMYGNMGKLGLAVGAKVNSSFYQIFQTTTAEFLLAKRMKLGKGNSLSFGINAGVILNNLKQDRINAYTNMEDPVLVNGTFNKAGFTTGLGFHYSWKEQLNVSMSVPVLVQSIQGLAPVYFTNVSYKIAMGSKFSLQPEIIAFGPNYIKPTIEGNFKVDYLDFAWLKLGFRSTQSFLFGAGASVKFVDFGYIYNLSAGQPFQEVYSGLHNIKVAFNFLDTKTKLSKKTSSEEIIVKN